MGQNVFDRILDGSLMPHGYCLLWRGDLLFLHLTGDIVTALAYFTIPAALVYLIRHRRDLAFDRVFVMFALFIFLCGVTHVISVINIWWGFYFIEGVSKLATGLISAATAVVAWRLLPTALAIPSQAKLEEKITALKLVESELARSNERLETKVRDRTRQLEELARTDELTGLNNRREMLARLAQELLRAGRYSRPLSIMLIDLDKFKAINDRYGHPAGDEVLKAFAQRAQHCIRDSDSLGRIGGEEFLVVLPDTGIEGAEELAQRVRQALAAEPVVAAEHRLDATCSIGVVSAAPDEKADELLSRADQVMYAAKGGGRNRVETG